MCEAAEDLNNVYTVKAAAASVLCHCLHGMCSGHLNLSNTQSLHSDYSRIKRQKIEEMCDTDVWKVQLKHLLCSLQLPLVL